jgi:hypothetical protein
MLVFSFLYRSADDDDDGDHGDDVVMISEKP